MPVADRNSHENLLLLCPTHHTLIDKEKGANFSVESLREMKLFHEREVTSRRHGHSSQSAQARKEYILSGLAASRARLITRWIAVGVDAEIAEALADDSTVGYSVEFAEFHSPMKFSILLGDFGSGKTVSLEREYQAACLTALEDHAASLPVFLDSKQLNTSVSQAVENFTSHFDDSRNNVTLFVDGLDEFGSDRIAEVSDELRSWSYATSGRKVLATSRPNTGIREKDALSLPPLTDEELAELLDRVGSTRQLAWGNSAAVSDALHRPLFALIAADCRRAGSRIPNSRGSFLEALVERALTRTSALSSETHSLMAKIGYLTTNSGGSVAASEIGGKNVQRQLVETRLIVRKDRSLHFALPVLGQYFAGQYVLENGLTEIAEYSGARRDQWREALTFAVSAGSWSAISALLSDLSNVDPGLAAWITHKAVPSNYSSPDVQLPEPIECAQRIHTALDAWLSRIGLIGRLLDYSDGGKPLPIAVGTEDRPGSITVAFLDPATCPPGRKTLEITSRIDWRRKDVDGHKMLRLFAGVVPSDFSAWPWSTTLEWIKKSLSTVLKTKALPLPDNPAYTAETLWNAARIITNQRGFAHRPIACQSVIDRIDDILEKAPALRIASFENKLILSAEDLAEVRALCTSSELPFIVDGMIKRPYPTTDIDPSKGSGHIASCYSDSALRDLVQKVYENATSIYEDLLRLYFEPLRRTLNLGGSLPVKMQCKLSRAPKDIARLGDEPMFSRAVFPIAESSHSIVTVHFVDNMFNEPEYSDDWLAAVPLDRAAFRRLRPASVTWSSPTVSHETLDVYGNGPATHLAYKWLWSDLQKIGLTEGNFPYAE